ncbi:TPA: aldehyde dehydrogenase family protein, partial [Streptococcus pneumoniae]|nr:aldehyde dehydrogenase family protein [Streptococcus pneumoniae]
PAGVFNTITGRGSEIGDYIIEHKEVNFINFTGSTPIGERIGRLAGMRPIMLELGGKDAALVLEDADLEHAAKQIVAGAFSYSGQRCTAIKRVIVLESVADKLATLLQEEVSKLTVGDPFDNADITPVIDNASADFIWGLIEDAQEKEAQALTPIKREGNLLWPVLFDQVTKDMKVTWEEPFGPVLPIIRVASVEEAIAFANESEFGLQSSVFTNDFKKAFEIAEKLEVGTVHINNKTQRGPDNFPFLGVKGSGAGVQGIKYSIEAMTNVKSIVFDVK